MKSKILDAPIKEIFDDFLGKGESIIWQKQPISSLKENDKSYHKPFEDLKFWVVAFFVGMILISTRSVVVGFVCIAIVLSLRKIPSILKTYRSNIHYAFTQQQILFMFKDFFSNNTTCYSIRFDEIEDVIINSDWDLENIGTIYIYLKNNKKVDFKTRSLRDFSKRSSPTLELLENPRATLELIRQALENHQAKN